MWRSVKRSVIDVVLNSISKATRAWCPEAAQQILQRPAAAMSDEGRHILDKNQTRPEGGHIAWHCGEHEIVLLRIRLVMVAVPDLAEALTRGASSNKIDGIESPAVPLDALESLIRDEIALYGDRLRGVVVVDADCGAPGVIGAGYVESKRP